MTGCVRIDPAAASRALVCAGCRLSDPTSLAVLSSSARSDHASVLCPLLCPLCCRLQDLLGADEDRRSDASGNPILKDVGPWLKSEIKKYFKECDMKYIDPS